MTPTDQLVEIGIAHLAARRHGAAAHALRAAAILTPGHVAAAHNLGIASRATGGPAAAIVHFRQALRRRPEFEPSLARLALVLAEAGRPDEAAAARRRGLLIAPANAPGWRDHAAELERGGHPARALALYGRTLALDATDVVALVNGGSLLGLRGDYARALSALRRAVIAQPGNGGSSNNSASVLDRIGQPGPARRWIERTLLLRPDHFFSHANLVMAMTYDTATSIDSLFETCASIARRFAPPTALPPRSRRDEPGRRLKVGYLSADLRANPIVYSLENLLIWHDRSQFEVHAFAQVPVPDSTTRRLIARADQWHWVHHLPDRAVAELVRRHDIDVLVTVAGWTAGNRPLVAAHRPAPVQISCYDLTTSGSTAMGYWLTDATLHPPGATRERFTEQLVRLPTLHIHRPPEDVPPPRPRSEGDDHPVTFGSCNNPRKIGEAVIELWARVLHAVPRARLLLKYRNDFGSAIVADRYRRGFGAHGIAAERLVFASAIDRRADHLQMLDQIDVALDPFPFNGSTTTFEALYMGVPVVTLAGDRFLGRITASFLAQIGLDDLVARDSDHYVEVAARLAADRARRAGLRETLRRRVLESPLCDGPAYARAVEGAFRKAWRDWCAGGQ
jgi:predicted O-linked N-acetylglucosamine transferase (SPINDLY family)